MALLKANIEFVLVGGCLVAKGFTKLPIFLNTCLYWFKTSWLFLNIKNKNFGKIWIKIFLPHPPQRGVLKKRKILNLVVEPKLLNMISYKHKDKKKSKRWVSYLKNWASYGYFRESTQGEISISSNFQIMKSHPVFEISTRNSSCDLNFDRGLTSK